MISWLLKANKGITCLHLLFTENEEKLPFFIMLACFLYLLYLISSFNFLLRLKGVTGSFQQKISLKDYIMKEIFKCSIHIYVPYIFLYRKNRYLTPYLKRLLCNALIQPHFDYAWSARYPNLNRNLKANCKLSKTNVLDTVSSYITEVTLEWKTLKKLTGSRFLKYLISTFVLTLLIFLRKLALYTFMIYI